MKPLVQFDKSRYSMSPNCATLVYRAWVENTGQLPWPLVPWQLRAMSLKAALHEVNKTDGLTFNERTENVYGFSTNT